MTNLAKGELVMDKQEQRKEVEFRLAKILLKIMQKNDLISNEEMEQAIIICPGFYDKGRPDK